MNTHEMHETNRQWWDAKAADWQFNPQAAIPQWLIAGAQKMNSTTLHPRGEA